jgi:hypothetical protein
MCFLMDIFIHFRTSFYDMETGEENYKPRDIACHYLSGRFTIDLLSTIPVDNIAMIFTSSRPKYLQVFSLLKLIRITRLSRIIQEMNVKASTKSFMKLFQMIFTVIVYIHL